MAFCFSGICTGSNRLFPVDACLTGTVFCSIASNHAEALIQIVCWLRPLFGLNRCYSIPRLKISLSASPCRATALSSAGLRDLFNLEMELACGADLLANDRKMRLNSHSRLPIVVSRYYGMERLLFFANQARRQHRYQYQAAGGATLPLRQAGADTATQSLAVAAIFQIPWLKLRQGVRRGALLLHSG
jgi:hypothetical protein